MDKVLMILPQQNDFSKWFEKMLSSKIMTASYKAFWLQGIIEELDKPGRLTGNEIRFVDIINRMIANAWFPIAEFRLNFGIHDSLGQVVGYIKQKYKLKNGANKGELIQFLEETTYDVELNNYRKQLLELVPYRLLSPFFHGELPKTKNGRLINEEIERLSNRDILCFYRLNSIKKTISINEGWIDFIKNNRKLLDGWIKYKIAEFIGKRNQNVPNILLKLDAPSQRKHQVALKYWKRFIESYDVNDIYTDYHLSSENFDKFGVLSVDHFIPWSFVLHDENWNLVPTFKNVNSSKSDLLPNLEKYLDRFCKLQYKSVQHMKESSANQKLMESYYNLNIGFRLNEEFTGRVVLDEEVFTNSLKDVIRPVYQIAQNQGFEVWEQI